jgi:3-isopropylmalate/(R)-2-methylmalate dehydratase small subunit
MTPVPFVEGPGVALPLASIDTDQLIPARFMSRPRAEGYGGFLLHDLRRDADGSLDPGFPLNAVPEARVLVARRNFGSGSSREAAVYALADARIGAVIAPSHGDIFASNAVKNGVVPARVTEADGERLIAALVARVRVDVAAGRVVCGDIDVAFALDEVWREQLVNGWDDVDLTRARADDLARFRERDATARPWARPG